MLTGDLHQSGVDEVSQAYLLYGSDGRLRFHSETLHDLFPSLKGTKPLIGMTGVEIRNFLGKVAGFSQKEFKKLIDYSKNARVRNFQDGAFELTPGKFFVFEDLLLPEGERMTLIRNITERKRRLDNAERLQKALSSLASQEAIYKGEKDGAFRLITEIVLNTLLAARADIWLFNVDASVLHQQQVCWQDGKNHRTPNAIAKDQCPEMFNLLIAGQEILSNDIARDRRLAGLSLKNPQDRRLQSVFIVPIRRGPRTIGAISVAESKFKRLWKKEEASFLYYAADLVVRMLEAHDRQVAEQGLRSFNEVLDDRVRQRTQELEQTLETLKLAQGELVRSEKLASLGGLVAGVAHEINTPLGVALTSITHMQESVDHFGGVLESGQIRRSDLAQFFETAQETTVLVHRNLERAANLVRSFRMVAVDQAMDDRRTFMLAQYIGEIIDSLKPTLRKLGVSVNLDCKRDVQLKTVPGDIAHILTNLIMNAALHAFKAHASTAKKQVDVRIRKRGDFIYMDVGDNGTGIPDEIKEKVFDPFFTTARAEGGSGLGLNIVFNTVYKKLGGRIELTDSEEGGALFKVRFPRHVDDVDVP